MNLQAVTICINYSDYLECVIDNRRHFDRWIIVTVADDVATRELCGRYGLECKVTELLPPDGKGFNAAFAKAPLVNEALAELTPQGWAIALDSDVLLPRHFRRRLEALPLSPGCIYQAAGRRVCEDREAFDILRRCEPWETMVSRNTRPLGYLNLFHLGTPINRYPSRTSEDYLHDDSLFASSFGVAHMEYLPMSILHVGPTNVNWAKRISSRYLAGGSENSNKHTFSESIRQIGAQASSGTAVIIGYFPGNQWDEFARHFKRVLLIDHYQIHAPSANPMFESDRSALRQIFQEEAVNLGNVELLGAHGMKTLEAIEDGIVDVLYVTGEIAAEWFPGAFRKWIPKLRKNAVVCGDMFGFGNFRETTMTVSLMFGLPDGISNEAFWQKQIPRQYHNLNDMRAASTAHSESWGVVVLESESRERDALLLTVFSVRSCWNGSMAVYYAGKADSTVEIVCHKLDIHLTLIGSAKEYPQSELISDVAGARPFERTLIVGSGNIAVKELDSLLEAQALKCAHVISLDQLASAAAEGESPVIDASKYSSATDATFVDCNSDPEGWSEDTWQVWCELQVNLATQFSVEIRLMGEFSIATIVTLDNAAEFQRNWLTWTFAASMEMIVVLVGIKESELWLPGRQKQVLIVEALTLGKAGEALGSALGNIQTEWIAFVPAEVSALPGAELRPREDWNEFDAAIHTTEEALAEERESGNRFIPSVLFGVFKTEFLRRISRVKILEMLQDHPLSLSNLSLIVEGAADAGLLKRAHFDATKLGWRIPASFSYLPDATRSRGNPGRFSHGS
jgi:hypothetical protein